MVDFRFTSVHGQKLMHNMSHNVASILGKKCLSKREEKKLQAERGKKGALVREVLDLVQGKNLSFQRSGKQRNVKLHRKNGR